ncbi:MAG: glycosyltransferase family 9 protein [Smithellaceae bacterium]
MKNILVIRTHRLGDILQLTPMFQGLKMQYPGSKIFFLTDENYVPLISGNTSIDAVIPVDEKKCRYILNNKPEGYPHLFNDFYDLIQELRKVKFDLIINRQYEFGAILAYLIDAPKIYGGTFSPERGHFFADKPSQELFNLIRSCRRKNQRNLTDWACRIAGIEKAFPRKIKFSISPYLQHEAKKLIPEKFAADADLIAVQMGAAKSFRQWGTKHFLPVLQWLTENQGKKIILTGNENEKEDASQISSTIGNEYCLDLTGKTSLSALAAVIAQCQLLLTPDTGTMHIATAVGTPVLALFYGGAYPWETGPYGSGNFILWTDLPCAPCFAPLSCPHNQSCKTKLTPGLVIKALETIINSKNTGEINWPVQESVKLLITDTDNIEQNITVVDGNTKLPNIRLETILSPEVNDLNPDLLLGQCEEIERQLFDNSPEKGFLSFFNLFNDFSLYQLQQWRNDIPSAWNDLYDKINYAMLNKDEIMLRDILKYEIEPIIKETGLSGRTQQ